MANSLISAPSIVEVIFLFPSSLIFFLVLFLIWFRIRFVLYDLKPELLTTKQYHFAYVLHKIEYGLQRTERIARLFSDYLPENGLFF